MLVALTLPAFATSKQSNCDPVRTAIDPPMVILRSTPGIGVDQDRTEPMQQIVLRSVDQAGCDSKRWCSVAMLERNRRRTRPIAPGKTQSSDGRASPCQVPATAPWPSELQLDHSRCGLPT